MTLPFSASEFFAVFATYNSSVWPAQLGLTGLAVAAVLLAVRPRVWSDRVVSGVLALLWIWMGLVYHVGFFRSINPAAAAFGALFALEGAALAAFGVFKGSFRFRFQPTIRGGVGALLIAYALVGYPVLAYAAGHRYPATPTFGLPCPTTIFTLGLLLWTDPPGPKALLAVPLAWSVIGVSAAVQLGVWEDLGLLAAGVLTALVVFRPRASIGTNS